MRIDIRDPIAHVTELPAAFAKRQAIQLQMIVRVDQARKQPIALQVDDRIFRSGIHGRRPDLRASDPQGADFAAAELRIDERQSGAHGIPRVLPSRPNEQHDG